MKSLSTTQCKILNLPIKNQNCNWHSIVQMKRRQPESTRDLGSYRTIISFKFRKDFSTRQLYVLKWSIDFKWNIWMQRCRACSATAFQVAFSILVELKLYFFKSSMFGKIAYQINFRVLNSYLNSYPLLKQLSAIRTATFAEQTRRSK